MSGPMLAVCSIAGLDRPLDEVAAAAAAAGAHGLELTAREPHVSARADAGELRRAGDRIRAAGLEPVAYGSYLGTREVRAAEVEREVARCEALGAPRIRVWAAPLPGASEEAGLAELVALLRQACDVAAPAGIDVVVERHVGSWADTPARVERLFEDVAHPRLGLAYQTLDFLPEPEARDQAADARRLAPIARYVHCKNYRPPEAPGGRVLPWASLAEGVVDQAAVIGALRGAGYSGPFALEFVSSDPARSFEQKLDDDLATLRRWSAAPLA